MLFIELSFNVTHFYYPNTIF